VARLIRSRALAVALSVLLRVSLSQAIESADDQARLARGEILVTSEDVPGRWVPRVHAVALFKAAPERVWAIISDCAHYKDNLPKVLESEELVRDGNHVRCRETIDMPFPFSDLKMENDSVLTVEPERRWVRAWQLREGDFNVNSGSWTLEPRDGGKTTLATYEVLSEPKVRLPKFIVRLAMRRTLPEMFDAIRRKVE